jgi:hypothetical protein
MPHSSQCLRVALSIVCAAAAMAAAAADIGRIKVAKGEVTIERGGQRLAATVGMAVQDRDVLYTGADGSVGISMTDNALLSAGPNSVLALEQYEFDDASGKGRFDASLAKGSLAVVSGRIAKQSPDAMTVRTPFAVLGVRGTEFAVTAHGPVLALP